MAEPIPFNELPRPNTPKNWSRRDAEETYQTLERELAQKHDKRGHLYLEPGKYAVLTAASSTSQYGIGINASDHLVLIDMATGNTADFVVNWEDVDGLEAQLVALETAYEDADATLTAAVAVNASAISDNETAIGAIETEITAARDGEASLNAKLTSIETAYASADSAIASDVSALQASMTAAEGDIDTLESTASNLSTRMAAVDGGSAASSTIDQLEARLTTNEGDISTNAAAITTEASARASGDSANASSIETLEAYVGGPNPNLAPNGGFELGDDGWTITGGYSVTTNAIGTYLLGTNSGGGAQTVALGPLFRVAAGNDYSFSAEGSPSISTGVFRFYIDWLDSGESLISNSDIGVFEPGWTRILIEAQEAPSGAYYARFRVNFNGSTNAGATARVRRFKAEFGSSCTAYTTEGSAVAAGAYTKTMKEAFVDSDGNAYASIRLVAAASGSDPAEIEILSGDGSSSVVITGDTFIDGDLMVSGSIVTDGLASNAVTNSQVSQTAGSISLANDTWTTVASFSFTSVGIGVELRGTCTISNTASVGSTLGAHEWRLRRDSTTLKSGTGTLASTDDGFVQYRTSHIVADYNDIPSSGTYTYALQVKIGTTTGAVNSRTVTNRYLSGREFKR
jgi:hypothetical protein